MPNTSPINDPSDVLFRPLQIDALELVNRLILGPMAALQPNLDGSPSQQSTAFLVERAKGGVGLIILGGTVASAAGADEAPFSPCFASTPTMPFHNFGY